MPLLRGHPPRRSRGPPRVGLHTARGRLGPSRPVVQLPARRLGLDRIGESYDSRGLKKRARKATRQVPIPPILVRLIRDHIAEFGTARTADFSVRPAETAAEQGIRRHLEGCSPGRPHEAGSQDAPGRGPLWAPRRMRLPLAGVRCLPGRSRPPRRPQHCRPVPLLCEGYSRRPGRDE